MNQNINRQYLPRISPLPMKLMLNYEKHYNENMAGLRGLKPPSLGLQTVPLFDVTETIKYGPKNTDIAPTSSRTTSCLISIG